MGDRQAQNERTFRVKSVIAKTTENLMVIIIINIIIIIILIFRILISGSSI